MIWKHGSPRYLQHDMTVVQQMQAILQLSNTMECGSNVINKLTMKLLKTLKIFYSCIADRERYNSDWIVSSWNSSKKSPNAGVKTIMADDGIYTCNAYYIISVLLDNAGWSAVK